MLTELIDALIEAMEHGNERAVKKAFSDLRKVGVDATTARIMVAARKDDLKGVRHD